MVLTQGEKSESMITVIRTEVTMDEDGVTEKLNSPENAYGKGDNCRKDGEPPEDNLFDSIMEKIGNDGKFQKRFDVIYNFLLLIFVAMPYLNIILVMTIPEHWCHVPGRELTNLTVDEWRESHIPRHESRQNSGFSSCKMYANDHGDLNNRTVTECQYGWDYDRTWYSETVPSQEDWVCDHEVYVSNVFAAGRIGEIIGTLIFGQLGDQIGRVPVFYISMVVLLVGRLISLFVSHMYYVFLLLTAIGSTASISVFQSTLVISMEVSDSSKRSYVAFLQCVGWVAGLCLLSLIAWTLRNWRLIIMASTLPCFVFFFMYRMLPESPRWLATKGHVEKSAKVLKYISRINGTKLPAETEEVLQKIAAKKEKFYGIPTLFLHWRLAKNTLLILLCWGLAGLTYYIIMLNVTTMSGNPFLNFFCQSLVELPGYILGKTLSNLIGRRWTQTGAYFVSTVLSGVVLLILPLQMPFLDLLFVSLLKMCLTTTFYMVWLQAIEIYPTCVRQTGTSIGGLVSNTMGIIGPYVVFLGTSTHPSIPYIFILVAAAIACVASSFLPETYNQKLPETLQDAESFGKDQKFWSFKIYRQK